MCMSDLNQTNLGRFILLPIALVVLRINLVLMQLFFWYLTWLKQEFESQAHIDLLTHQEIATFEKNYLNSV